MLRVIVVPFLLVVLSGCLARGFHTTNVDEQDAQCAVGERFHLLLRPLNPPPEANSVTHPPMPQGESRKIVNPTDLENVHLELCMDMSLQSVERILRIEMRIKAAQTGPAFSQFPFHTVVIHPGDINSSGLVEAMFGDYSNFSLTARTSEGTFFMRGGGAGERQFTSAEFFFSPVAEDGFTKRTSTLLGRFDEGVPFLGADAPCDMNQRKEKRYLRVGTALITADVCVPTGPELKIIEVRRVRVDDTAISQDPIILEGENLSKSLTTKNEAHNRCSLFSVVTSDATYAVRNSSRFEEPCNKDKLPEFLKHTEISGETARIYRDGIPRIEHFGDLPWESHHSHPPRKLRFIEPATLRIPGIRMSSDNFCTVAPGTVITIDDFDPQNSPCRNGEIFLTFHPGQLQECGERASACLGAHVRISVAGAGGE